MNKNTKVFIGDKQLRFVRNKKGQFKKVGKELSIVLGIIFIGFIVYLTGYMNSETIIEIKEIPKVIEVTAKAKVLERIIQCESGNTHYDKNGQVLVRGNEGSRASVDIGVAQINGMYWGKKATELGLNLMVEEDNRKMAEYIFNNHGTDPWNSSKKCWNK